MTPSEARSKVAKLNAALLEVGLAIAINPLVGFKFGNRTRLSWPAAKEARGLFSDQSFGSLSEYHTCLLGNHYTCLLNEGSLLQVSYDFENGEMVAHRLCFYPCPLVVPANTYSADLDAWDDLLEQELFKEIESLISSREEDEQNIEAKRAGLLRLRSPVRFDYEPDSHSDTEPSSHVHIGDGGVRVPVHAAISLNQFIHFVITHFYPSVAGVLEGFAVDHHDRCISARDETRLHLDCRKLL